MVSALSSDPKHVVASVGEGVTQFEVDQRVVPILYWNYYLGKGEGAWQDYIEVAEEDVVAVPSSLSDETAAQYLINPWTAYGILTDVDVPQGKYLIQTAAASTIGRQVIQLCKHLKIKTINVVRRDEYVEELKAIGGDEVINSTTEDVVKRVKQITKGAGAYAAIDAVGGMLTKEVAASVQDGGKIFVYGTLGGWDITVSKLDLMRRVEIKYYRLSRWLEREKNKEMVMRDVMRYLETGVLVPNAGRKFDLEDFRAAIVESERDARGGKVLLVS